MWHFTPPTIKHIFKNINFIRTKPRVPYCDRFKLNFILETYMDI